MSYDTVFFDLDGTLVDPCPRLYRLFAELTGCELTYDEYWQLKGKGLRQRAMLEHIGYQGDADRFSKKWLDQVEREDLLKEDIIFPDVLSVLEKLYAQGLKIYVVTNRQSFEGMRRELNWLGLGDYFTQLVTTRQQMPKAEAVKQAGINYQRGIFVGDSKEDMEAARNLSVNSVLIQRKDKKTDYIKADFYISHMEELGSVLNEK